MKDPRTALRRPSPARRGRRGQSTVEFLLMMPLIMAMFFFIIEMSIYFTSVHYTHYATFAAARGHAVGEDPQEIADMLLTGNVYKRNTTVNLMRDRSSSNDGRTSDGVRIRVNEWVPSFPFLASIMPSSPGMTYATSSYLGPPECTYEETGRPDIYDNNVAQCCFKSVGGATSCL